MQQIEQLSYNYKLMAVNILMCILGLIGGAIRLGSYHNMTWFERFFEQGNTEYQLKLSWILIALSVIAGVSAVILYVKEEKRVKKIQEEISAIEMEEENLVW